MTTEQQQVKVALTITKNFNDSEVVKLAKAGLLIQTVLNDLAFQSWVKTFKYEKTITTGRWFWKRTFTVKGDKFHYNTMTNQQVLDKIISGAEELNGRIDYCLDINESEYYTSRNVIGYGYGNSKWQFINSRYFHNFDPADTAGNLIHEALHKLGFDHEYNDSYEREFSVPYAVGYEVERRARILMEEYDKSGWPDYSGIIVATVASARD